MPEPENFDKELCELAADQAPRLFAVVQEYVLDTGEPEGVVAAWGMAYEDGRAHVISVGGGRRLGLNSAERAAWWFGREDGVTARLVWFAAPAKATFDRAEAA